MHSHAKSLGIGFTVSCLFFVLYCRPLLAGDYLNSSHGNGTSGVDRSSIDARYNMHSKGNCAHCHEQHASLEGTEPNPVNTGPSPYGAFATEQNLCFECHDADGPSSIDIWTEFNLPGANKSKHGGNLMELYDDRHLAHESTKFDFLGASARHAECTDCHNPHKATTANPLLGATGVDVINGSSWTEPQISGNAVVEVRDRMQQYKICFKCHSGWGSEVVGTSSPAREFNTNNPSYHNIEGSATPPSSNTYGNFNIGTGLVTDAGGTSWSLNNLAYKMMPRYNGYSNADLRNVQMLCSDCHGDSDTSPQGVHGSTIKKVLKVPDGSPYTEWNNTLTIANRGTVWCFNCHDPSFTNSGFSRGGSDWHTRKHSKSSAYCQTCHSALPHGWKRTRALIYTWGTTIDPAPYNNAPNQGLSDGIVWQTSGNWRKSDCHNGGVGNCG